MSLSLDIPGPPPIIELIDDLNVCQGSAFASNIPFATTPTTANRIPMKRAFKLIVVLGMTWWGDGERNVWIKYSRLQRQHRYLI